jgi:hypothetical protein
MSPQRYRYASHLGLVLSIYLSMALQPFVELWPLISYTLVGLLGRGISPSQGRYLHTEQTHTDIHALSAIRTHDHSVQTREDSSCLRPRGHCDQLGIINNRKLFSEMVT